MGLIKSLATKAIPFNNTPANRYGLQPYQLINGRIVAYTDNKANFVDKGYMLNEMVYAVVNLILDKVRLPQWGVYKVVDEQALKQYKAITSRRDLYGDDYRKALKLHKKAVEPVADVKLEALLYRPNDMDEWNDFITNGVAYKMITGDKFVLASLLDAGANIGLPQELYNLPAQNVTIVASNTFPVRELGYILQHWQLNFPREKVLHEKYWNPTWSTAGDELYGLSPLKAALRTIQRSNSANTAGTSAFENMGPPKIIFADDARLDADDTSTQAQMMAIKQVIQGNEYSGSAAKNKMAVSAYKMGVIDIGLSPVDLNIIESQKWDLRMICNIFGVPSQLLNDPDNKTYNNQKEGEAALTSRCAIPQLSATRAAFNRKLHTDWGYKNKNVIIDYDPNVFTELQQNTKEIMEWMNLLPSVSPNEMRTMAGMDAISDTWADEQWIKTSDREPYSSYEPNIVDDALNSGADIEDGE